MGRVLVVDGDAARRVELGAALGNGRHEVELAAGMIAGSYLARTSAPDLLIVDAVLPDGTATQVCTALRRDAVTSGMLVLVIGTASNETDRIAAFEAGADDYVVRPFSTRELMLRVRALLRRVNARSPEETISLGTVRVHRGTRRVTHDGANVVLTRREFDLLMRLVDGRGRVLARETIVADVWPEDAPSERVVDTTLKRLRKKLPAVARRIRTIRGIGYEMTLDDADSS